MDRLTGIHAVREALEAGRAFDRIVIARGRQDTRVEEIVQLARGRNVSVRFEDRSQIDRLADTKDHQGIVQSPDDLSYPPIDRSATDPRTAPKHSAPAPTAQFLPRGYPAAPAQSRCGRMPAPPPTPH